MNHTRDNYKNPHYTKIQFAYHMFDDIHKRMNKKKKKTHRELESSELYKREMEMEFTSTDRTVPKRWKITKSSEMSLLLGILQT